MITLTDYGESINPAKSFVIMDNSCFYPPVSYQKFNET